MLFSACGPKFQVMLPENIQLPLKLFLKTFLNCIISCTFLNIKRDSFNFTNYAILHSRCLNTRIHYMSNIKIVITLNRTVERHT